MIFIFKIGKDLYFIFIIISINNDIIKNFLFINILIYYNLNNPNLFYNIINFLRVILIYLCISIKI